jgi:hypothetical protein
MKFIGNLLYYGECEHVLVPCSCKVVVGDPSLHPEAREEKRMFYANFMLMIELQENHILRSVSMKDKVLGIHA